MSDFALRLDRVSKKFRKGEIYDSLRDLIPAMTRRLLRRPAATGLGRREFWALRDIDLVVPRGEALGVIGSNGAGKSTMLKLLTGIMRPTTGSVTVRGRLSALIEVSAGFHPDLTGRENIFLNGTILGMSRKEIQRRFDEIVAFSGLEDFIDTPVKRFSSGMFARLGFAVAAHVDPDVLIVDEVLSVGDYVFQRKSVERMRAIMRGGATVIFVSHNLRAVAELCDRALLLHRGQAVFTGAPSDAIRQYLDESQARRATGERPVSATSVTLRDDAGPAVHFASGQRAFVDVEVASTARFERLAVVIDIKDAEQQMVFNTSSERLSGETFTLEPGQRITCTFELALHLAPGRFHVCVWVYRYDTQTEYDAWENAATFFVSSDMDVRGVAHLRPTVSLSEVTPVASDTRAPTRPASAGPI